VRLYTTGKDDIHTMERAINVKDLPDGWRFHFIEKLNQLGK
jgi:hypothetical protein